MPKHLLLALVLVGLACPWVLWTWVPAPKLELWYVAALLRELRLVLAAPFVLGLVVAALELRGEASRWPLALLVVSVLALARLGHLELRAWSEAALHRAPLSLGEYVAAPFRDAGTPVATREFARPGGEPLLLDVWEDPVDRRERRPAIVRVHGGSWEFGERSEAPHWNRWLVDEGFVVFDVDYRLTPPPRWVDATGDVKAALAWVARNADAFRVDVERLVLMGASAGGHLALLAAYTSGDALLTPSDGSDAVRVAGVVAISPPVVLDLGFRLDFPWWMAGDLRDTSSVEAFLGGTPSEVGERYRLASPTERVVREDASLVPTFLVHGAWDPLVRAHNCEELARRLGAVGGECELLVLRDGDHLFERAAGGWSTQVTRHALAAFLARWR